MLEPGAGHFGHGLQRAGLVEEMRGARDDPEQLLAGQGGERLPVKFDDVAVIAADDQERGRRDFGEHRPREIGATAARDHRGDPAAQFGGGEKRRAGAGAGAEETQRQVRDVRLAADPERRLHDAFGQQGNVEDVAAVARLVRRQQIEQERGESLGVQRVRDGHVARAEAAGAAAMGEKDDAARVGRHAEVPGESQRGDLRVAFRAAGRRAVNGLRPCLPEKSDRLLVGQLVEIVIEAAHASEAPFGTEADDQVGLAFDVRAARPTARPGSRRPPWPRPAG